MPHHEISGQLGHPTKTHVKEKLSSDRKHINFNTLFEIDPSPQVIKVRLPNLHIISGLDEASTQSFLEGHWSRRKSQDLLPIQKEVIKMIIKTATDYEIPYGLNSNNGMQQKWNELERNVQKTGYYSGVQTVF